MFSRLSAIGYRLPANTLLVGWAFLFLPISDSRQPVAALLAQPPAEIEREMRPSSGIEPAPEPWWTDWPTWAIIAGIGLLGIAAGGALALRLGNRKPSAKSAAMTPQAWALQELARLEGSPLAQRGEFDAYHTQLSNLIRRYLEQRFQLKATKQTTPEFLVEMRSAKRLNGDQQALLRHFMEQCDLVKFGGVKPTVPQCFELVTLAKRLVQQTA